MAILFAITNQNNSVIDVWVDLVAAIEDTAIVGVPIVCINRYGHWAESCNSVHQLAVVVLSELYEAGDLYL